MTGSSDVATTEAVSARAEPMVPARSSRWRLNARILVGGGIVALMILVALLAPIVAPYDPLAPDPSRSLGPPTASNVLGNDEFGRDVLSRLIYGARISLTVSIVSVALALAVGTAGGLVAGY